MIPKYYFPNDKSPLKKFSDDIIDEITVKYSSKETISSFIKDYEGLKATTIYKDIPYKLTDTKCEYCNELMYHKVGGKGGATPEKWLCSSCKHNKTYDCYCENCFSKKKALKDQNILEFKKIWKDYYQKNYSFQYQIDELTVYDQIYLRMIIEEFTSSDQECLTSDNYSYERNFEFRFSRYDVKNELVKKAVEFIKRKIFIPKREQVHEVHQFNTFTQIIESFDFLNTDWIVNIKNPYENENTIIENLAIYFALKNYSELEKTSLFRDVYDTLIKKYVSYLAPQHLNCLIDELAIDFVLDDLSENLSLSKAFSVIYYSISSTEKNMKKYNYSDQKKINTHFRNRVLQSIELHQNKELIIKDFNLPSYLTTNILHDYVVDKIFHHKDSYFYLNRTQLLY